ncbi:hypothetical protein [Halomonas llamarensis]|uniref:Uncharacterized protein n=1 Tax=Halomonas llamarensis TaxID=2945104 RepID=A0ABT0SMY2_9GAMM|nr:hypothetical protein [Halomonas llamarensis]MCL7929154.1 hypothetical protein [Halomonas llamarensis]
MLTSPHEKAQRNGWAFSAPLTKANAKPESSTRYGARLCLIDQCQPFGVGAGAEKPRPVSGKGVV